jgi:S-formylglutathione hydrolase
MLKMTIENISSAKVHGGWHKQYSHNSVVLNCPMRFAIFLPPQAEQTKDIPVLYWLSGLTCTDENFMQKAGAFEAAAKYGIAIVAPDTSPRGDSVANDESYDLGQGAGFYVNATEQPWKKHYQMYDYIIKELPSIVENHLPVSTKKAISGHSMGGHGALTIGLKNPELFTSISAFSPICHPIDCPWGQKAFSAYLGDDQEKWRAYDACEILKSSGAQLPILVDQGSADQFLAEQLRTESFIDTAQSSGSLIEVNYREGYDHSYFFINSFINSHIAFHAKYLKK